MIKFILFDGTDNGVFINFLDAFIFERLIKLDGIQVYSESRSYHGKAGVSWIEFKTNSDLILFKLKYL